MGFILISATVLLCVTYAALLMHFKRSWKNIHSIENPDSDFNPSVHFSIVIPARNESENIINCLDSILAQKYPTYLFEIIVVDDHSEDDTCEKVQQLNNSQISLLRLQDQLSGIISVGHKKRAIEAAVKKAKGSWIVTTDADCCLRPCWLLTLAAAIENENPDMIVMPVRMKGGNNFIGTFDSMDFLTLQGITGAAVSNNELNMCNGANLAYSKNIFERVNGFSGIDHISSGDDMLLMEKIANTAGEIYYLKSKNVIADTTASTNTVQFLNQRIRWASKSAAYRDKRMKLVLALVYFFNLSLLITGMYAMTSNDSFTFNDFGVSTGSLWLATFIVKFSSELAFLSPVANFFEQKKIMRWFILMQPVHILYIVISGFLGLTGSYRWKGRIVK